MTKEVKSHELLRESQSFSFKEMNESSQIPSSSIELSVKCSNLVDLDFFTKSDPICLLFVNKTGTDEWTEYGRTEVVMNNLNPDFVKKFIMDYCFEESQKLRFDLYTADSLTPSLKEHDFLGSVLCTLAEIVSSGIFRKPIKGPKKNSGTINITAEELSSCKEVVTLQFCGHKLDRRDLLARSDPFLKFYRTTEDGSYILAHKSEVVKNTQDPTWRPLTITVKSLCNGDYDRVLRVECLDYHRNGGHECIGSFLTTLTELKEGKCDRNHYECINDKKKAKKGKKYKNSGTIELLRCSIETVYTFVDYVKAGTQIHCTFAIDFTASNGDPRTASSLHNNNPYQMNQYANAIQAVGNIIQDYDSDKLFPVLGFGAKLPQKNNMVSHEFFVNGHPTNPYCEKIEGVLEAYYKTLNSVTLYGPTNFAPCINHVARIAKQQATDGKNYFILLILTDGIITDEPQTAEAIVNASDLPISLIIVGIGDADFSAMDKLDGDVVPLSSRGRFASRDIVQFVPFRDFINSKNTDMNISQMRLARSVLEEIPEQFLSYMKENNITPSLEPSTPDFLSNIPKHLN